MSSSENTMATLRKELYLRLEDLIKINDIDAVKKHTHIENLTHVEFVKYSEEWLRCGHSTPSYPVTVAAKCGNVDIVNYFISIGFHKNHDWLTTPLSRACSNGHLHVVRELIEVHDVDINSVQSNGFGRTPLIDAILAQQLEIVQYLLKKGASTAAVPDQIGHASPLHAATSGANDVQLVQLLLHYVDVNFAVKPNYDTALFKAAARASGEVVKALLDAGADVDGNMNALCTPFYFAVVWGELENARLLYSRGANPNILNKTNPMKHVSVLESALNDGSYEVICYLVVELNLPWDEQTVHNEKRKPLEISNHFMKMPVLKLLADSGLLYNGSVHVIPYRYPGRKKRKTDMALEHLSSYPRTLKQISCFKVRRIFGKNLSRVVDSLPLPRPLMDFVKLTHIPIHIAEDDLCT